MRAQIKVFIFCFYTLGIISLKLRYLLANSGHRAMALIMRKGTFYSSLDKFGQTEAQFFIRQFQRRFQRSGHYFVHRVAENFLIYLKMEHNVNPLHFLLVWIIQTKYLPFKLYKVRLSNRNYLFPGPFHSQKQQLAVVFAFLAQALHRRSEQTYDLRFFSELLLYFSNDRDSLLNQYLDHYIDQGYENRAFLHYRWMLKRNR